MPTPVPTAKQCLSSTASHALDEAVGVARRRSHAQTTSLHAISALLSLTSSQLKEACIRARNSSFYPKTQLKALELSLSVSLDRLPRSHNQVSAEYEPPVSNSLMAAIKRSQANQRRHPEFISAGSLVHDHHHQVGNSNNNSQFCVKVELQQFILSILDDPVVSRVFNDAGFRSFDVKVAIMRPFQSFLDYPYGRSRASKSMFLFDLDKDPNPGFRYPVLGLEEEVEGYRRIGEVLVRRKGRNPLLVGGCASDVLRGFVESLDRKRELVDSLLPIEVKGINVVSFEENVVKFMSGNLSDEAVNARFKEVEMMVDRCPGARVMVSVGDLRCFLGGESGFGVDVLTCVVRKLSKLLNDHRGRVWLIGCAANDQTYVDFLRRFPLVDKDWDLQLLPITSVKPLIGEACFKSSLMGSFVPFGGFFSLPSDLKCSLSSFDPSNKKSEPDAALSSKRDFMSSVADQHQNTLSPWLRMTKCGTNNTLEDQKAKGGNMLLSDTLSGLGRKLDSGHQIFYPAQSSPKSDISRKCFQLPSTRGFHQVGGMKYINDGSSCTTNSSCKDCDYEKVKSCVTVNLKNSTAQSDSPVILESMKSENLLAKLNASKASSPQSTESLSPHSLCISAVNNCQISPSRDSVSTDLGLDLFSQPCKLRKKSIADVENRCDTPKGSKCSRFDFAGQCDSNNFKTIFNALFERVGRQSKAVQIISQTVAHSWTSNKSLQRSSARGDIWMHFVGSDLLGKKKTALALATVLYGGKNNLIHVDFSSKDGLGEGFITQKTRNTTHVRSRGKTVVDHIAEELRKTPCCIVLIEHAHRADPLVQRSLMQAVISGKFADSYGREVPINNKIFVLTSKWSEDNLVSCGKTSSNYLEERIAKAKGWPIQILVEGTNDLQNCDRSNLKNFNNGNLCDTDQSTEQLVNADTIRLPNKTSALSLDLNLPAEDTEETNEEYDTGNSASWLEDLSVQADKKLVKVVFDRFDYDALATKLSTLIHQSFRKVVGSYCLLEMESRVMEQLLAAACFTEGDREVEDWIKQVLSKAFAETRKRYQLTGNSTVIVATCGPLYPKEHTPDAFLPSTVMLT